MDLNKVMVIGRLTRDPEGRTTTGGQTVSNFGIATNLMWTDANGERQKKTEFHNIVAWRRLAEICNQYLKKGHRVYIEGRLQTREWQGTDGVKRSRTEIIADNMIMLEARNTPLPQSSEQPSETLPIIEEKIFPEADKQIEEIKVEDIPF